MPVKMIGVALFLILALIAPLLPACTHVKSATAYTAVIPAVFQSSAKQAISVALFAGDASTSGNVRVTLLKDNKQVSQAQGYIQGNGTIQLETPDLAEGDYTLQVKGESFEDQATVKVQNNYLIFLETDKPIYKPGQSIQIRALTLDSGLTPVSQSVTLDILDAKGIKIFRDVIKSDEYGMAETELPISSEPNLGTWKITAATSKTDTQLDVKVEEYVLPKYEVKVDLPKDWYLVNEQVKGKVKATYSYGRPVKGDLRIVATKYVGAWQNYAEVNLKIDGEADFTLPAADYVAGVPAAQGNGNVKLQFIVTETSTGYQEKSDTLLNVSQSSVNLSIIPSGSIFKPGLPYSFLVIAETPDNKLVDTKIDTHIAYFGKDLNEIKNLDMQSKTEKGKILVEISPPLGSVALTIECNAQDPSGSLNASAPKGAAASKTIEAAYSPSSNFIHLEQVTEGTPNAGDILKFFVFSTSEAKNFYYEVISRGRLVFSDYTQEKEIILKTTPAMAPSSRLLVYQILPNAEIAADYLPFELTAQYPQKITLEPSTSQAKPGDNIEINIQAEDQSEVGLAAVDKSVFILAENRVNLQQVFDQLEKLYMNPQAELHEVSIFNGIQNRGAKEVFQDAGVIVLSNKTVPEGQKYESPMQERLMGGKGIMLDGDKGIMPPMIAVAAPSAQAAVPTSGQNAGLAEVQRVRQFFPETWIWDKIKTDASGKASFKVGVPDTITTWMIRAVAVSKTKGLGIAENQLTVFQPFFLTIDLPYSAIRGEEFPVSVAIYNYLDEPQSVNVQVDQADWFKLLDDSQKTIEIPANDIGSANFKIKPVKLGNASEIKVTARSKQAADAVIKTLIVEPEGVSREIVDNITLSDGKSNNVSTTISEAAIEGSARAYFAVTSSYLAQTIDGLESLIQMPFGCGEQNMIIFAPDVYITRYLQSSGQLKPEIMAKAEKLMLTGYQRELTYRRTDGSFSAFGQSDEQGSLWLTAFVLKCFSEAKGLIYIDEQVLEDARKWILSHQNSDGSFNAVGFVHHAEMLGGLKGQTAITAYATIALLQSGEQSGSARSVAYLEKQLDQANDAYTLALVAYALELAGSTRKDTAHDKLMGLAKKDDNGLYWGDDAVIKEEAATPAPGIRAMPVRPVIQTSAIEATAYAALALTKHGDTLNASSAAKWLVSKRNAYGGFGSTQDTVMALQALIEYSSTSRADVNLTVQIGSGENTRQIKITSQNYDVLQIVEIPVDSDLKISTSGKGEAIGQVVRRFNLPEVDQTVSQVLKIDVVYDAKEVAVNDEVTVAVDISYNPPAKVEAGMVVVDISVPTGFAAVKDSLEKVMNEQKKFKRYDISGRKVIFYVENLLPGDRLRFQFQVKALYPVKAKAVVSQAYSYYQPEIAAESIGTDITVVEK